MNGVDRQEKEKRCECCDEDICPVVAEIAVSSAEALGGLMDCGRIRPEALLVLIETAADAGDARDAAGLISAVLRCLGDNWAADRVDLLDVIAEVNDSVWEEFMDAFFDSDDMGDILMELHLRSLAAESDRSRSAEHLS